MNLNLLLASGSFGAKAASIFIAVVFFGMIIFVHELGHFLSAKLFKVKVNEFALGMGPTIFKKKKGDTVYALRLFPIGGFVSMEGEDENSEDIGAFCNKKLWQRMIVLAAGAFCNIVFGVILCAFLVGSGEYVGTNTILNFYDGAVSNSAGGLTENDKILEIDGKRIFSDYDISFLMQRNNSGKYDFVVERNGEVKELPGVRFAKRTGGNFAFDPENVISSVSAKMKKAGLEDGDKIIRINGKTVKDNKALSAAIDADTDFKIDFTVLRNQGEVELKNVELNTVTVFDFVILGAEKSFFNVTAGAFKYAASMSRMVYLSLFDLLRGQYGLGELAGPIGTVSVIADIAQSTASEADFSGLFTIMALITINVGLFNLLPVPALDGGRLFFMFIELIFRKPIPAKYEGWIHAAGLILLFGFMIIVSASDLWKLISGKGFY